MFKTNEYFEGKVKSISYQTSQGAATIGVMAKGVYEFGTSTVEYMTIISGSMEVLLPDEKEWKAFSEFETFIVPGDAKFTVKVAEDTAYRCYYR